MIKERGFSAASPVLVLVPDQYTLEAERQAFRMTGRDALIGLDVYSISRLEHNVIADLGQGSVRFIDKYGRQMLLTGVLAGLKDDLEVYGGNVRKPAFIEMLNDYISQLKQYDVTPELYRETAYGLPEDDALGLKMRDISKIYTAYDEKIAGKYTDSEDFNQSYRETIRICTRNHPWATFGNDMLLGVKADLATDRRQQEFLPEHLLYDFDRAQIYINGEYRPMVKERRTLVPAGVQIIEQDFLFSPTECACALLILSIVILAFEWRRKKTFRIWDGLLMVAQGLVGLVLFVMLFSQHPTTSTNLQILLLNPLPFFFLPAVARRRSTRWWILLTVMFVLFMIGSLFQQYAEGMQIVALCLLLRSAIHFKMKA